MPRPLRFAPLALGALALLVAAYANHFGNPFHFDDGHSIVQNAALRDLANVPRFFVDASTFSTLPTNQMYRPLLLVSYALDIRRAGGLVPSAFHQTTFAFYVGQCVLMLALFRLLLDRSRPHPANGLLALFGTALYALHPVEAETINYVSARSDSLSTFLVVASVLLWVAWPRGRRWGVPILLAVLATLVKQTGIVTPALVLLLELLVERRPWREAVRSVIPFFAVLGALFAFMATRTPAAFTPGGTSRLGYVITQPYAVWHYVRQLFLPTQLTADTDLAPFASPLQPAALWGFAFTAALLAATVLLARRRETGTAAFGLAWFFIALSPTSSVIPLAEVVNDHRMYFPFVGLVLTLTSLLGLFLFRREEALRRSPALRATLAAAAAALLLGCAWGTRTRNTVWSTDESLWRDAVAKSPRNGRALMNYGLSLMARGDVDGALGLFRRALELTPYYSYLHTNIGIALATKGRLEEADESFRRGIALAGSSPEPAYWYARFLAEHGRWAEALSQAETALAISPGHPDAQRLLAELRAHGVGPRTPEEWLDESLARYRARDYDGCLRAARQALDRRPGYAEAYNNICSAYNATGRWDEAITACETALRLRPDFPLARNNLAWARGEKARQGRP